MASRRMISIKIIDSARFIKMPSSTQALYFHLISRADDDGIVEAFNVMRMTGSTEDDLKILVAKGFVIVLNEDLVSFISDWQEHNKIRADRKVDSIYQDLLLKVLPEVQLLESRERADRLGTSHGQPEDSIGKDRLGKDSKDKIEKTTYLEFVRLTDDEYKKLVDKLGQNLTNDMIERLNNYIGSKGKKYKSHYHTILSWHRKDNKDNPVKIVRGSQPGIITEDDY